MTTSIKVKPEHFSLNEALSSDASLPAQICKPVRLWILTTFVIWIRTPGQTREGGRVRTWLPADSRNSEKWQLPAWQWGGDRGSLKSGWKNYKSSAASGLWVLRQIVLLTSWREAYDGAVFKGWEGGMVVTSWYALPPLTPTPHLCLGNPVHSLLALKNN